MSLSFYIIRYTEYNYKMCTHKKWWTGPIKRSTITRGKNYQKLKMESIFLIFFRTWLLIETKNFCKFRFNKHLLVLILLIAFSLICIVKCSARSVMNSDLSKKNCFFFVNLRLLELTNIIDVFVFA